MNDDFIMNYFHYEVIYDNTMRIKKKNMYKKFLRTLKYYINI